VEEVLPGCQHIRNGSGQAPLDDDRRQQLDKILAPLHSSGHRLIAVALEQRIIADPHRPAGPATLGDSGPGPLDVAGRK
jgi:hypothetical protein